MSKVVTSSIKSKIKEFKDETDPSPMRKVEKEEWFHKNLRAVEAQKLLSTRKDIVSEKSVYFKKIKANSDEAKAMDPIFLKAYGVSYNAERSLDI